MLAPSSAQRFSSLLTVGLVASRDAGPTRSYAILASGATRSQSQTAYYALVRAAEVTLQSGRRYFIVQSERTEMKPLPINPNVISPIVTLEIRTIPFNAAGAKDAAQIARNSQVAGVRLETATVAALAGLR